MTSRSLGDQVKLLAYSKLAKKKRVLENTSSQLILKFFLLNTREQNLKSVTKGKFDVFI